MKRAIVRLVLVFAVMLGATAIAGPLEDATAAYRRGDYATALPLYRSVADAGNATAQLYLGYMYRDARGVAKDDAEALKWLRKAAEQGDARGQNALGFMYRDGRGVTRDDGEAVQWFRKAAEQGNADGENNLGNMYEKGRGIANDDVQAVQWYRKAAEQGNAYGENNLGRMYRDGRGITQDDAAAVAWFRKAAEQRHADAQMNLGFMHEQGRGVSKDEAQAVESHRRPAEQGLGRATDSESRIYAVLSVIGDKINIIGHAPNVASRLDKNQDMVVALTDRALDNIAVLAAKDAINRLDAHAAVVLLTSSNSTLFELQDKLFEGRDQATATLESVRAMLSTQNATHLVFIAKRRDEAALREQNDYAGSGHIEGLGFYLDQTVWTRDTGTNAIGQGFIAAFAYIRVMLVDATTMTVIREQIAEESMSTSTAHVSGTLNPWDALTKEQKVTALRNLINKAIGHAMPSVLGTK